MLSYVFVSKTQLLYSIDEHVVANFFFSMPLTACLAICLLAQIHTILPVSTYLFGWLGGVVVNALDLS